MPDMKQSTSNVHPELIKVSVDGIQSGAVDWKVFIALKRSTNEICLFLPALEYWHQPTT